MFVWRKRCIDRADNSPAAARGARENDCAARCRVHMWTSICLYVDTLGGVSCAVRKPLARAKPEQSCGCSHFFQFAAYAARAIFRNGALVHIGNAARATRRAHARSRRRERAPGSAGGAEKIFFGRRRGRTVFSTICAKLRNFAQPRRHARGSRFDSMRVAMQSRDDRNRERFSSARACRRFAGRRWNQCRACIRSAIRARAATACGGHCNAHAMRTACARDQGAQRALIAPGNRVPSGCARLPMRGARHDPAWRSRQRSATATASTSRALVARRVRRLTRTSAALVRHFAGAAPRRAPNRTGRRKRHRLSLWMETRHAAPTAHAIGCGVLDWRRAWHALRCPSPALRAGVNEKAVDRRRGGCANETSLTTLPRIDRVLRTCGGESGPGVRARDFVPGDRARCCGARDSRDRSTRACQCSSLSISSAYASGSSSSSVSSARLVGLTTKIQPSP